MAQTSDGIEFHLLEVFGEIDSAPIDEVEKVVRSVIRKSDGAFREQERLYIAFAGDVRGSAIASRRLMSLTKEKGIATRYRLVVEPFPEDLWDVASKIIRGEVKVANREKRVEPPDITFLD